MREVLTELETWWQDGQTVGVGLVVDTWQSAPRPAGAAMLVGPDGSAVGSVSGGCVEGAVYDVADEVRRTRRPILQRYGVSDGDAAAVGLTCGGIIDVFVMPADRASLPHLAEVATAVREGRPVALAVVIAHPDPDRLGRNLVIDPDGATGELGSSRLDDAVRDDAQGMLVQGRTGIVHYGPEGERRGDETAVFIASYAPRPRMIVFGAIDFAAAVARVGAFLGYHVTVCDARPTFATTARFPDADEVVVDWPHRYLQQEQPGPRTVVCVLTHDPKFDVPLLEVALRMPLAYVGAMGSRRTHDDRLAQLRERGLTDAELAGLHAPIGLDIGARTPEETAVSIAAEIIRGRWGGTGHSLAEVSGPIHHPVDRSERGGADRVLERRQHDRTL
jgi:xanthine dehydrogenase accessory factor